MDKRTIAIVAASLLVGTSVLTPPSGASDVASGSDWPEFHGPGRRNISPDKGLLTKWPEGGPRKLWTYSQCGRGYSGVSIAEGMIFTAGDFDRQERVLALNLDGKLMWQQPNGDAWRRSRPFSSQSTKLCGVCTAHQVPVRRFDPTGTRAK